MYKIAVLGDYNSIYGFAALGLDTFPVEDPAEGKEVKVNQLTYNGFIAEGASQSAEKDADGYYVIKK